MSNIVISNTEKFERRNRDGAIRQQTILSLPTITASDNLGGIIAGLKQYDEIAAGKAGANINQDNLLEQFSRVTAKSFMTTGQVADKETMPTQKTFDNFYGPLISQSAMAHTDWYTGTASGFIDMRCKALSTEAQGLVSTAIGTLFVANEQGSSNDIPTGWLELYTVTDALLGKTSVKILNLRSAIRVQKLPETGTIKPKQPLNLRDMQETSYTRYGICFMYADGEGELSDYFNTVGGINGLFREFRTAMASTKASEAYRYITTKPKATYCGKAVDIKGKPSPASTDVTKEIEYQTIRAIVNIKKAHKAFLAQMRKDGLHIQSANPIIHVLYNPTCEGATIIENVLDRLNDKGKSISMPNLIFHAVVDMPVTGAWVQKKGSKGGAIDEYGFEEIEEAGAAGTFGIMFVLPKEGNIHGVNRKLYSISKSIPEAETTSYMTFERYTFHPSPNQRFWLQNLATIKELDLEELPTGE